ncbi:MAG: heparan-alpha-glucosaminide N-acetyltransferase domain-containing protein [Eubacterium sp.]
MIENKRRIHMLDEIRGFAIICMIFHHAFLDIGDVLGLSWGYKVFDALCIVQPIFWGIFIIISGMCSRLSRNTVKRGVIVLVCGGIVTLFTAVIMPLIGFTGAEIYFGILHCLGACMIITGLLMPLFKKIDYRIGAAISLLLYFVFNGIEGGTLCFGTISLPESWYQYNITAPLGFHNGSFYSADYFPVLPWLFMFFFGSFIGKIAADENLPEIMYVKHCKFLSFVGKNSLWVYLAHQPVLYAILFIIAVFIS